MIAVKKNRWALMITSEDITRDMEIVMSAVKKNGEALMIA